jgi:hypothetical protein
MDFKDELKQLGEKVIKLKDSIQTEEATKNAFIMPFIRCLGYDVFDPHQVTPEYIQDVGIKKGEKIDYAILRDGHPVILVECKHHLQNLDLHDGQLLRYYHISKAKFGLLTNGIIYRFYSDLVQLNKMDEKPFLEVDITELKDNQVEELKKFHKSYFDVDSIYATASELKYTNELKALINAEFNNPSSDFVKHFAKQVYPSVITQKVLDQFTNLTKKSINQYVTDLITERLKSALTKETEQPVQPIDSEPTLIESSSAKNIETTAEELEAFYVVKSIVRSKVDLNRLFFRDAQSYFSIILDDNNRKPICRIYFNSKKKIIGVFDANKVENKFEINQLDDIFKLSEQLLASVEPYLTV